MNEIGSHEFWQAMIDNLCEHLDRLSEEVIELRKEVAEAHRQLAALGSQLGERQPHWGAAIDEIPGLEPPEREEWSRENGGGDPYPLTDDPHF